MEQQKREGGGAVRFKQFERTVVEGLNGEEWGFLQQWLEEILGHPQEAAQQIAEMRAYVKLLLRHQNN